MGNLNMNREMNFDEMAAVVGGQYSRQECLGLIDYGFALLEVAEFQDDAGDIEGMVGTLTFVDNLIDEIYANC
jgi:hypothetical protein